MLSFHPGLAPTLSSAGRRLVRVSRWWKVRQFFRYGWREVPIRVFLYCLPFLQWLIPGLNVQIGRLYGKVYRQSGEIVDYGLIGVHLVVTAGKTYLASSLANSVEPENLRYHGYGTGTTAAAAGDTALQTELTTQYATDNTRPTGSQSTSTNTYTTVGTVTPDSAVAVTEWGLLSQAATGGGTLLDRQVFSAINLNGTGDSLQTTYVFTQN